MLSGDSIFIVQSLTSSKMRKSQTKKLSRFHKAKTCWTENNWSSGIYVFGGKKKFEFIF